MHLRVSELGLPGINRIEMARYVYMGPGLLKELPEIVLKLGYERPKLLIVTGSTKTLEITRRRVLPLSDQFSQDVEVLSIDSNMSYLKRLRELLSKIKGVKPDLLIGVGGGRVLDATKIFSGLLNLPYINIPTNASHDGTASPVISSPLKSLIEVILNTPMKILAPEAIIADIEIIASAPRRSISAGVGDMVAKFTAVKDWRLAYMIRGEEFSEYAAALSIMSARLVARRAKVIGMGGLEGTAVLVKALIGSGVAISIAGSSRPASGSEHLFSHALDYLSGRRGFRPAMHGEQCGVGAIMMAKLHGINWRRIREVLKAVGAPVNAEELGIEPRHIVDALTIAHRMKANYYTILGESGITRSAAVKLAVETGVIPSSYLNKL